MGAEDVVQDKLAPLTVAPFWSVIVAESCCVSPSELKFKLVAESVIDVATGVVGVAPPSPQAESTIRSKTMFLFTIGLCLPVSTDLDRDRPVRSRPVTHSTIAVAAPAVDLTRRS